MIPTRKVLIIDDEPEIVALLAEFIASASEKYASRFDLHIETAGSGDQAIEKLKKEAFDLVFIDLKMPGFNGDQVVQKVRGEKGVNQEVPFVVVSGFLPSYAFGKDPGKEIDKVYFVDKPFDEKKILRMVQLFLVLQAAA